MANVAEASKRMQNFISWIKYGQGTLPHCICGECERSSMEAVRGINVGDLVYIPSSSESYSHFLWTVVEIKLNVYVVELRLPNGIRMVKELPEKDLTFVE